MLKIGETVWRVLFSKSKTVLKLTCFFLITHKRLLTLKYKILQIEKKKTTQREGNAINRISTREKIQMTIKFNQQTKRRY